MHVWPLNCYSHTISLKIGGCEKILNKKFWLHIFMRSIIDHRKFTHFSYIFALIYIFYSLFFVLALSEIDIDDWWKPKIRRGSCVLPRTVKKVQVHVIFDKYANNRITKPYNRIFLWLLFGATSVIYFSKFVGSFFVALSTCITYTYMYIISKSVENILCTMNTNQNKWTDHLFQFIWSAAAEKTPKIMSDKANINSH